MNKNASITLASYFGLCVEVISRLASSSLIRFRGREFIVDNADLVFNCGLKQAA
jgi:hypothetical protein